MSTKKSMLVIWAVATLLWTGFCSYMFKLGDVGYAYRSHQVFAEKVARGRAADPFRWDYNMRGYERTARLVEEANKNLGLFLLLGLGFPGIMLAIGTVALENVDKPKGKQRKTS